MVVKTFHGYQQSDTVLSTPVDIMSACKTAMKEFYCGRNLDTDAEIHTIYVRCHKIVFTDATEA